MKKIKIFLVIILLTILVFSVNISYATSKSVDQKSLGDMITGADGFIKKANEDKIEQSNLQNLSNTVYNVLLVLAIVISVLVGAILGIKLIMSGATEKADIKQAMMPYVIGNVVVFGSFVIWKIVVLILNQVQ